MKELYPDQQIGYDQTRNAFRRSRRVLLQAPTGWGKTQVANTMMSDAVKKGGRPVFVVDRVPLVDQTSERLDEDGLEHGVIQADHWRTRPHLPIQVASVQTLSRRDQRRWPPGTFFIFDEVHVLYKFHKELMTSWNNVPVLGLTATPWSKGLGRWFDTLVNPITLEELIDKERLCDFQVYGPSIPDLTGVRTVAGDYNMADLTEAVNKKQIIGDIVKTWLRLCKGQPTIAFCVDIAHSKAMAEAFKAAGVSAAHLDTYDCPVERARTIQEFKMGYFDVLCNVGILDKGFDYPECSCVIQARPTKSLIIHFQQIGRVLRYIKGKLATILDHAGNHERLGFVTDPTPTFLCTANKGEQSQLLKERENLPRACGKCGFMKKPGQHACPRCGHAPERQADVEYRDGELEKLKKSKKHKEFTQEQQRDWVGQLKTIAKQRGHEDIWWKWKFKAKFDIWPNAHSNAPPRQPTTEVLNWVKYLNIRRAKSKKNPKNQG